MDRRNQRPRSALELIMRVSRAHKRILDRQISELGIHGGQHRMLMTLSRMGQFPAQNELARRMDISPATAATMLKRLESGGYIERRTRTTDERCNEVKITEKGQQVVDRSVRLFEGVDEQMFMGFSREELEQLSGALERVHANLRKMEEEIGCAPEECARSDEERNETRH